MDEGQDPSVRVLRRKQRQALIGIIAEPDLQTL
jgi:hypothetical protein